MKKSILLVYLFFFCQGLGAGTITKIKNDSKYHAKLNVEDLEAHEGGYYEYLTEGIDAQSKIDDAHLPVSKTVIITTNNTFYITESNGKIYTQKGKNGNKWEQKKIQNQDDITVTINNDGGISLR